MSEKGKVDLFVVRLYDGFDHLWMDVSPAVPKVEAESVWMEKTGNGTHHTKYEHIDYYKVFPAGTRMLYSTEAGFDPEAGTWKGRDE